MELEESHAQKEKKKKRNPEVLQIVQRYNIRY